MCAVAESTIHPFEAAGLGQSPFRFLGISEKVYVACLGAPEQPGGTCDYCGTGIRYCCHIRSADKKEFVVGCDCVRKLDREDNKLLTAMERAEAKLKKEKRDAARKERWEAERVRREEELQSQRICNGGLTDAEVSQAARQAEENKLAVEMRTANGWLIGVLEEVPYASDFVDSMLQQLQRTRAVSLSERCKFILRDIYGKVFGRRNSAMYADAVIEFDEKVHA